MKTTLHRPGDAHPTALTGDFILTHADTLVGKLIRFGEKRVGQGRWNHAALCLDSHTLAEALGGGVVRSPIDKYDLTEYVLVSPPASAADRLQMYAFALSVLRARQTYGYLEILCLGITLLLRLGKRRVLFGRSGSMICSGFVGEALTRAGAIFDVPPGYLTPDDLGRWAAA